MLNFTEGAHMKNMSPFDSGEHLQALTCSSLRRIA